MMYRMNGSFAVRANGRAAVMIALIFLSTVSGYSYAQESEQLFQGALKNIKQAGMCRDDDHVEGPSSASANPSGVAPDIACAISHEQMMDLQKRTGVLLADVRQAADFELSHMEGALNITLPELRTKPHLREKTVVLIGNGKGERELYVSCANLRKSGFKKVHVLRGGMAAWIGQNRPVIGRQVSWLDMARLNAGELWLESRFESNAVLITSARKSMERRLPGAVRVKDALPETIVQAQKKRKKTGAGFTAGAVVLVSEQESLSDKLRLAAALDPIPLLFYDGSDEAFANYIDTQPNVWAAHARGPKRPSCGR